MRQETLIERLIREEEERKKKGVLPSVRPAQAKRELPASKKAKSELEAVMKALKAPASAEGKKRIKKPERREDLEFEIVGDLPKSPTAMQGWSGGVPVYEGAPDPRLVEYMREWDRLNPGKDSRARARVRAAMDNYFRADDERDQSKRDIREIERYEAATNDAMLAVLPHGAGLKIAGMVASKGKGLIPVIAAQLGVAIPAGYAQEEAIKVLAPAAAAERARLAQQYPNEAMIGQIIGSTSLFKTDPNRITAFFSGDKSAIVSTLVEGGLEGGLEAAQQLAMTGNIEWDKVGIMAALGSTFVDSRFSAPKPKSPKTSKIVGNAKKAIDAGADPEKVQASILRVTPDADKDLARQEIEAYIVGNTVVPSPSGMEMPSPNQMGIDPSTLRPATPEAPTPQVETQVPEALQQEVAFLDRALGNDAAPAVAPSMDEAFASLTPAQLAGLTNAHQKGYSPALADQAMKEAMRRLNLKVGDQIDVQGQTRTVTEIGENWVQMSDAGGLKFGMDPANLLWMAKTKAGSKPSGTPTPEASTPQVDSKVRPEVGTKEWAQAKLSEGQVVVAPDGSYKFLYDVSDDGTARLLGKNGKPGRRVSIAKLKDAKPLLEETESFDLRDVQDPELRESIAYRRQFSEKERDFLEPIITQKAEQLAQGQYGVPIGSRFVDGPDGPKTVWVKGLEPGDVAYGDVYRQAQRSVIKQIEKGEISLPPTTPEAPTPKSEATTPPVAKDPIPAPVRSADEIKPVPSADTPQVEAPPTKNAPISGGMKRTFMLGGQEGARNTGTFESVDDADLYHYATQRFGRGTGKTGVGKAGGSGKTAQQQSATADEIAPELMERLGFGSQSDLDDAAKSLYDSVRAQAKQAGDGADFVINSSAKAAQAPEPPAPKWRENLKAEAEAARERLRRKGRIGMGVDPADIRDAVVVLADDIINGVEVTIKTVRRYLGPEATDADVEATLKQLRDELPDYESKIPPPTIVVADIPIESKSTPAPPSPKPPAAEAQPDAPPTATMKATEDLREKEGLPKRKQTRRLKVDQARTDAEKSGMIANADVLALEVIRNKGAATPEVQAAIDARAQQIAENIAPADGNPKLSQVEYEADRERLEILLEALELIGSNWSLVGNIRQRLRKADMSAYGIEQKLKRVPGIRKATADKVREAAAKARAGEKRLNALEEKINSSRAAMDAMKEVRKEKRAENREQNKKRSYVLWNSALKLLKGLPIRTGMGLNLGNVPYEDFAKAVKMMAKAAYLDGRNSIEEIAEALSWNFDGVATKAELIEAMRYVSEKDRQRLLTARQKKLAELEGLRDSPLEYKKPFRIDTVKEAHKSSDPEIKAWAEEMGRIQREIEGARRFVTNEIAKAEGEARYDKMGILTKFAVQAMDFAQIPRMTQAMGDLSMMFNQGYQLFMRGGLRASMKSTQAMTQAFTTEGFDSVMSGIRRSENFNQMESAGVYMSDPDLASEGFMNYGERLIMSRVLGKVPIYSHIKGWSERVFAAYLNKARAEMFDHLYAQASRQTGRNLTKDELKFLGDYVNVLSGRGNIGAFGKAAGGLYAPRFFSSQLQTSVPGTMLLKAQTKGAQGIAPTIAKDEAKFAAGATFVYGSAAMAASMFGWDLVANPVDNDFGQIKIPFSPDADFVIDLSGGRGAILRTMARLFPQRFGDTAYRSSPASRGREMDPKEYESPQRTGFAEVAKFARGKLAPVPGWVLDLHAEGRTPAGVSATYGALPEQFLPLFAQEIADNAKLDPFVAGMGGAFSFVGIRSKARGTKDDYEERKSASKERQYQEGKALKDAHFGILAPRGWNRPQGKQSQKKKEDDEKMSRALFNKLPRDVQRGFLKNGGKVAD